MSDYLLPPCSQVLMSVYYPVRESAGVAIAVAASYAPADLPGIVAALKHQSPAIAGALPETVQAGPPITIMIHITLTCGHLLAGAFAVPIGAVCHRDHVIEIIFTQLVDALSAIFERVRAHWEQRSAALPGTPTGNAPGSDARH